MVKIVNLYGTALGHNGDDKNIKAFERQLSEMGIEYSEKELSVEDKLDFKDADIIFMTHGKPRNIEAIAGHFLSYKKEITAAYRQGKLFVITGASNMLWGKKFTMLNGKEYEGIGVFDEESSEFDGLYVSDAVLKPAFSDQHMFGCYYKYAEVTELSPNTHPLFEVLKAEKGKGSVEEKEGHLKKGVYATWALGPIMLRNPVMMREILKKVLKNEYKETDLSLEEKAVELTLSELEKN